MRFPDRFDLDAALRAHPSLTARALAGELAAAHHPREEARVVRLVAAWNASCWRDPTAQHPDHLLHHALTAIETRGGAS